MDRNFSRDASSFPLMEKVLRSHCLRAILASCMALAIISGPSGAWAASRDNDDKRHSLVMHPHSEHSLRAAVTQLQAEVQALKQQLAALSSATPAGDLTGVKQDILNLKTRMGSAESTLGNHGGRLTAAESSIVPDLAKYVSINTGVMNDVKGPNLIFKGVNVHVQSGMGATADTSSGLGNLILGYNETATGLVRVGSHNLVAGQMNSFSSYGGLVFGMNNKISGEYAAVLGGGQNTASGRYSTVYGGQLNTSVTNYDIKPMVQSSGGNTSTGGDSASTGGGSTPPTSGSF